MVYFYILTLQLEGKKQSFRHMPFFGFKKGKNLTEVSKISWKFIETVTWMIIRNKMLQNQHWHLLQNEAVWDTIKQETSPLEDLITTIKERKLTMYGHVKRANNIFSVITIVEQNKKSYFISHSQDHKIYNPMPLLIVQFMAV